MFGVKKSLSGNTWGGSVWDGVSVYVKQTQEYVDGKYVMVTSDFRKYSCVEDSSQTGQRFGEGLGQAKIWGWMDCIVILREGVRA